MLDKYKHKYKELVAKLKCANYRTKYFRGGRIFSQLTCRSDKIVMPKILRKYVINRNYIYLLNPVIDCTDTTIHHH